MKISIVEAKKNVIHCMKAGLPVMLHGSPSTSKSSILREIAHELKLVFIDIRLAQMDPISLLGYPTKDGDKASFIPFDIFPVENTPIPKGMKGFLICLDEINSAPKLIQSAAYKLILDRQVGNHKLHPKCFMVAAGNLQTDGAVVTPMSTALQSRMVHLEVFLPHEAWLKWAIKNDIDSIITTFMEYKPSLLNSFDPKHNDYTYACGRTWEQLSKLRKVGILGDMRALEEGCLGAGVAAEFRAFCEYYTQIPTIKQIMADPLNTEVFTGGLGFAVTGSIGDALSAQNADVLMQYINRMSPEYQIVAVRKAYMTQPDILENASVDKWLDINAARFT